MSSKKLKRKQAPEPGMADRVKESAHQIWLAGLGAFSRAQAEGQKVFDTLVRQGESLASQTRDIAGSTIGEAQKAVNKTAGDVRASADETWNRLESVFENRVARTLKQLNIPSAEEIEALTRQVEDLHKQVNALKAQGGATASAARRARAGTVAGKKSARKKKTTARKASSKKTRKKASKKASGKKTGK